MTLDPGYACCVGKECDEGVGGKCYRSCSQIPPSMQEIGSFPPGKIHIQTPYASPLDFYNL